MGLETSIVETDPDINLIHLYYVYDAINEKFDWYLGDDKEKREDKHVELMKVAKKLTRDDILLKVDSESDLHFHLMELPISSFNQYITSIIESIQPYTYGDTHLFFDIDKIPGTYDLSYTCSYFLTRMLEGCMFGVGGGDIHEIDIHKLKKLVERWNGKSFTMHFAKWVGYFFPAVKWRILEDLWEELLHGAEADALDLIRYKDFLNDILEKYDVHRRLWIVKSY